MKLHGWMRPVAYAVACLWGAHAAGAMAQTVVSGEHKSLDAGNALPPVVVTDERVVEGLAEIGSQSVSGRRLLLQRAGTVGETMSGLPGVTSTGFGPNVGRPVVRGQDSDRVPLLSNGGAALDASALSQDHAVPLEPLVVERIELLRGPAALRYSGNGVGGVVNLVDRRVPNRPGDGWGGAVETRLGGAARERSLGGVVDGAGRGLAAHADVFVRDTDDLHAPSFTREDGSTSRRVINSASHAEGGGLGGSLLWDHGHLGVSLDSYRSHYGTVAEEDVTVRMQRDTVRLAGEWRQPAAWAQAMRLQVASTDYEHRELEGEETGTVFSHKGVDGRIELDHAAVPVLGGMRGMWGVQLGNARFAALGEEAFVPRTHSTQQAVFALESWQRGAWVIDLGLRAERSKVRSAGDEPDAPELRFGAASERRFNTQSVALGSKYPIAPGWTLLADVSRTERAPSFYELYAQGVHVATAAYEIGNPDLRPERGVQLEVGFEHRSETMRARLSVFDSEFSNYITQTHSPGDDTTVDGEVYPAYRFEGVRARLTGFEASVGVPTQWGGQRVMLEGRLDAVRATHRDTGEPLPRVAPLRAGLGLSTDAWGWTWRLDVDAVADQDRFSADDTRTPGYTLLHATVSRPLKMAGTDGLLFIKLNNLSDEVAYNATAFSTVRGLSPAGGRAVSAGLRMNF